MVYWHAESSCNIHYINIAAMVSTVNLPEPRLLAPRYPHIEPVDPSLTLVLVNGGYLVGHIDMAMLTLVLYNAC